MADTASSEHGVDELAAETPEATVGANLAEIRERIEAAASAAGRSPGAVTLIAVSKTQPIERVRAALAAGHRVFGENRLQEAKARWPALKQEYPDIELHFVGPLQTNKVADAVALFDVIHSVDRPKLARKLVDAMAAADRKPRCFLQVNTGAEPQKAGVAPEEADAVIAGLREDVGLPLAGLMCIPPVGEEPALHFALLAEIAKRAGVPCLSMGMSADFETAVRFGATHVRVGTAIFGERQSKDAAQA